MITFIISVKHYKNCHSYDTTWKLLENTLVSVCNQTDKNFNVIVVSNKTLNDFSNHPKIKNVRFLEVNWAPPAPTDSWQCHRQVEPGVGMSQIKKDRGTKYALALSQIQKANKENHYVMFVDADDFIHKKLARYVNNSKKDFLKVKKGYKLLKQNKLSDMNNFSATCGTSNITKLNILKKEINFNEINLNCSQEDIINSTTKFYLYNIIGAHQKSFQYFSKKGYKGESIPFRAAVYNCTHDEQHSGSARALDIDLSTKNECGFWVKKAFSIKTL